MQTEYFKSLPLEIPCNAFPFRSAMKNIKRHISVKITAQIVTRNLFIIFSVLSLFNHLKTLLALTPWLLQFDLLKVIINVSVRVLITSK